MNITLGEVGTYINGYAFKPSDWGTSGLPIIRIQNLTNQNTVPNYFDGPYNSKFEVNKGDILIAWSGSLGIHIWQKNKALLNQHIFRVEFNKCDIDKMYFYYAVKYNIHKMLHLTHGATMRHIIKSDFEQIIIPYPRLEIQVKISKVLNYLDQNIINYKNILIKLELLIKSRFVELFGDIELNEKKWKKIRFGELINSANNGLSRRGNDQDGNIVLRLIELQENFINYSGPNRILLTDDEKKRYRLLAGDLLFARVNGNPQNVGRCATFCECEEQVSHNDHIIRTSCDKSQLDSVFAAYLFNSEYGKNRISKKIKTSAGQYTINQEGLKSIDIILPPIGIQYSFAELVKQINKLKSDVQKSIDETQLLMDSLMQEYFC
jgi:type I restriction enzyme S subunit